MAYPRLTLADLAPGRSNVSEIILRGGQAQADAALRGGDAMANAIGSITGTLAGGVQKYGEERRQQGIQKAVRLATSPRYPSATKPVPGSEAAIADPGPDHMRSILDTLSPEDRPLAIKGIQEIQSYADKVQEHNLTVQKLKGDLADAETKRKTVAADYGAGLGRQISQWLSKPDGGLSAALFGLGHAKGFGTQGLEEIEPTLQALSQEWDAAAKSGSPEAMQAAAEKNRQTIGPLAQQLQMGASPEWQEKNKPKVTSVAEGGRLVNEETGATVAEGAPRRETRSVDDQIAAAHLVGDEATVAKLTEAKRLSAAAGRDPNVAAARVDAARARDTARFDAQTNHSYEYNDKKLEARAKPLTDQAARFDRLVTTVNEKTAQADSLVAPELLTVMAGGSGSGLRMTKAELEAVVGGRDKWAGIEVALKQWVPGQALKFTDAQRGEIQKLLTTMGQRIEAKASAIEEARDSLIDAKDVTVHRRILADLDKKLGDVGKDDGKRKNPFR